MLKTAQLVPGTESPSGDGLTGALRCVIELPDGTRRAAVLKRGPFGEIAAEAFSACLLIRWGLPVPQPHLVHEDSSIAFASSDAGYPSLKRRLSLADLAPGPARAEAEKIAAAIAISLPSAPLAAAADEAIQNVDRNLGNILWDGASEAWIDHADALGNLRQPDANKLCAMSVISQTHAEFQRGAVAQALAIDRNAMYVAAQDMPAEIDGQAFATFVAARVTSLASTLLTRFPQPQDLLSGA